MTTIKQRVLSGQVCAGTFLNLGSALTVELAANTGFDWLCIDTEHGAGGDGVLLSQLQAAATSSAAPIVRIAINDVALFKRVLDLGAAGVMIPYVSTVEEAKRAVASLRYPPQGIRGVAKFTRASGFATNFESYFQNANQELLTVVQIETPEAVDQAAEIARVDGVDVLFVGPLDLSVNLGITQQYDHELFRTHLRRVVEAARGAGKAAGILVTPDRAALALQDGFTFVAVGSDGAAVAAGMQSYLKLIRS